MVCYGLVVEVMVKGVVCAQKKKIGAHFHYVLYLKNCAHNTTIDHLAGPYLFERKQMVYQPNRSDRAESTTVWLVR